MASPAALVVEDAPEFARLTARLLESEGFAVTVVADGARAVDVARKLSPELMVLDVTLPGLDGIEVCRRIRAFTDCYVIMVTARDDELDRVLGLTIGADDYVTKPFSPRELTARIRAMRRRPRVAAAPELRRFEELEIDPAARQVRRNGSLVELTRIEFDILDLLSGSPRRTFERHQLMDGVWGSEWFGDDHVIDVHLANLRKKLGESASAQRHIHTVRGVGYRFEPSPQKQVSTTSR